MLRLHAQTRALPALLLLAGVICGCNAAEDGGPSPQLCGRLTSGDPVFVRMWGERCDCTYAGTAGEILQISVRRSNLTPGLDPNVRLLDPSGTEEAFDDDSGGNGDALIQEHVLRSSGTYTVSIGTDEDRTGELAIVLISTAPSGPQPVPDTPATAMPAEDRNDGAHVP